MFPINYTLAKIYVILFNNYLGSRLYEWDLKRNVDSLDKPKSKPMTGYIKIVRGNGRNIGKE
jgi:hypothetical protein